MKDQFIFSKNSWHMKLMTWIWGYRPENFRNICPYFWLSVFNIVFIIPIVIIKLIGKVFLGILDSFIYLNNKYINYCDRKEQAWIDAYYLKIKTDMANNTISEDFKKLLLVIIDDKHDKRLYKANYKILGKFSGKESKNYYKLKEQAEDQYLKDKWERVNTEADKKVEKANTPIRKSTEQLIGKMIPVIKWVFKILGIFLIVFLIYELYKLLIFIDSRMDYPKFLHVLKVFGEAIIILVIAIVIIAFIIMGIKALVCKYAGYCIPCEAKRRKINKFFTNIWNVISYLRYLFYPILWIIQGIIFIWDIIVAIKKDHCPGLIWKEDENI